MSGPVGSTNDFSRLSISYWVPIAGVLSTLGIGSFAGFTILLAATHLYSPAAVGFTSIVLNGAGLVNVASSFGISSLVLRRLGASDYPNRILGAAYVVGGLSVLVFGIAYSFVLPVDSVCDSTGCGALTSVTFVVLAFGMFIHGIHDSALFALNAAPTAASRTLLVQIGRIVLLTVLSIFSPLGIVISTAICYLAISWWVHQTQLLPRLGPLSLSKRIVHDVIRKDIFYTASNYAIEILVFLPRALVPLILARVSSIEDTAKYYVVTMMFSFALLPATAISTAELAVQSREASATNVRGRTFLLTLLSSTGISLVFLIIGPYALSIFGEGYGDGTQGLMRLLGLAILPVSLKQLFLSHSRLQLSMAPSVLLHGASGPATVLLGWIIASEYGLLGIGAAVFGVEWTVCIAAMAFWRHSIRQKNPSFCLRSEITQMITSASNYVRSFIVSAH